MKTNIHFSSYFPHSFLERKIFQTKVIEKIKTNILYSLIFLNHTLYEIMWKLMYSRTGHKGNMVHAHCMLDKWGYRHMLICDTDCFFMANNGCTNTLQCYVICTVPILFHNKPALKSYVTPILLTQSTEIRLCKDTHTMFLHYYI